jgi:hypothetical protein
VGRWLGAILAAVALMACGYGERANDSRPDVVLITIDTLRPDRLSAYGHDRETSPFIDALAGQGARRSAWWTSFRRSPMSWEWFRRSASRGRVCSA